MRSSVPYGTSDSDDVIARVSLPVDRQHENATSHVERQQVRPSADSTVTRSDVAPTASAETKSREGEPACLAVSQQGDDPNPRAARELPPAPRSSRQSADPFPTPAAMPHRAPRGTARG